MSKPITAYFKNSRRIKTMAALPCAAFFMFVLSCNPGGTKNAGNRETAAPKKDTVKTASPDTVPVLPLRAAFYDPADTSSIHSLVKNIGKVNMLLPELMYIDPHADTLFVEDTLRGATVIKKSNVKVVAMLSNYFQTGFNGATVHRILHTPAKRQRLIADIAKVLAKNKYAGVNIDLEELQENSDEPFITFMKELYAALHPRGFMVTVDIAPFNEDYNIPELAKYNDYLFLMAYDEHHEETEPGAVSSGKYVRAVIANSTKELGKQQISQKVVLCIAGYGYDWKSQGHARAISYAEAVFTAKKNDAAIHENTDRLDVSYHYSDKDGDVHEVHFTNAAINLSTLEMSAQDGLAGVALWRLGREDPKIWDFYAGNIQAK